ncbi:MAG TPA: transposase [Kiritimatiellia bacterium]|nr:transposase [Kiritimatiellia bacterium]HRZ13793.1 transposase [Kiritimatiellia bacterium]HSA19414.1 transposase [Kiritimatiellia bacterium]
MATPESTRRPAQRILQVFVHRLANAASEGLNNKIQTLIKKACGYRNRSRFKTDIFFDCGGLDLYPPFQPVKSPANMSEELLL